MEKNLKNEFDRDFKRLYLFHVIPPMHDYL